MIRWNIRRQRKND